MVEAGVSDLGQEPQSASTLGATPITTLLQKARATLATLQSSGEYKKPVAGLESPRDALLRDLRHAIDDAAHALIEQQRALSDCAREVSEDDEALFAARRWIERLAARVRMAAHNAPAPERDELHARFNRCLRREPRAHAVLHSLRVALAELETTTHSPLLTGQGFAEQGQECERLLTHERRETAAATGRLRAMNRDLARGERRLTELLRRAAEFTSGAGAGR
jgi:hypothetical protein